MAPNDNKRSIEVALDSSLRTLSNILSSAMKRFFDQKKATQIAAYFIEKTGGVLPYISVVKMVYLAEREALKRWQTPLTFDLYYSLPHGPIVSNTMDLASSDPDLEDDYWHTIISGPNGYDIGLKNANIPTPKDALSRAEIKMLDELHEKFGHMDKWQLRDFTHELPEYTELKSGRESISYEDILQAVGFVETTAKEVSQGIHERQIILNQLAV